MVESTFKVTLPVEIKKLLEDVGTSVVPFECLQYLPEEARLNLIAGVLLERKAMSILRLRQANGNPSKIEKSAAIASETIAKKVEAEAAKAEAVKDEPKKADPKKKDSKFKLTFVAGESQLSFLRRQIPEYLKTNGQSGASEISRVMLGSDQPNHLTQTYTALKHLTKEGTVVRDSSGTTYVYRLP